jgi:tRNA threonylcarbamoyladenosine biosynthesis protein TsaE
VKLTSASPEETEAIGLRLGKLLKQGASVGLYGDLGTGKTTMVRGIATAFGIDRRDVTSASFTIIAEYPGRCPFFHIDLYRIEKEANLDATGIWDCLGSDGITVIEWAERLGKETVGGMIRVELADRGDALREISIEGIDEKDWNNLQDGQA